MRSLLGALEENQKASEKRWHPGLMGKAEAVRRAVLLRLDQETLVGKMFGRLYVEKLHEIRGTYRTRKRIWECRCLCGNRIYVMTAKLKNGHTKSCGCLQRDSVIDKNKRNNSTEYGAKKSTKIYSIWNSMVRRCYSPSCSGYKHYGGRGIKVCDRWKYSFDNFYKDMWPRPAGTSLDRIDVNGDYSPENCRWASNAVQARNRTNNHWITYKGESLVLTDMAKKYGIRASILNARITQSKWSVEKAIETPIRTWPSRK